MGKFLSIIIPRYKETEKDMFPLLSSINGQIGIDFSDMETIISNDGDEVKDLHENYLGLFEFDIQQISTEKNGGPGVARQRGLDVASGQYVMFCDADDTLHNVGVLGALIQEAENNVPDIISSSWLEEIMDGTRPCYVTHENENTWMHGKLFRRKFLEKNHIRFHDDLRVHEDSYFLSIAAAMAEKRVYIPVTTYVWKYNEGSITRRDGASYTYSSVPEFVRACTMSFKEIERRAPGHLEYKILQFTLYNYFCLHQPGWQVQEKEKYLKAAEDAFASYMAPMWHYWKTAPKEVIAGVYAEERTKNFAGCIESETVWEWIERLGLEDNLSTA